MHLIDDITVICILVAIRGNETDLEIEKTTKGIDVIDKECIRTSEPIEVKSHTTCTRAKRSNDFIRPFICVITKNILLRLHRNTCT